MALLRYAVEKGAARGLFEEVRALLGAGGSAPGLEAACSPGALSPDLQHFVAFMAAKGREDYLVAALRRFVTLYCRETGTVVAHLSCDREVPGLPERLSELIAAQAGVGEVIMETTLDPSIGGGFILDVEDMRLDASLRRQIDIVRRSIAVSNKKMV